MNKVMLVGEVAADPELRFTQAGQGILNLRVVTTKHWSGKDGVARERRDFHSCTCWGKRGEELATVLRKDMLVSVEGELQSSSYEDKDGKKVYKTEVNASAIELLGASGGSSGGQSGAPAFANRNQIPFGTKPADDPYAAHGIDPMTMY